MSLFKVEVHVAKNVDHGTKVRLRPRRQPFDGQTGQACIMGGRELIRWLNEADEILIEIKQKLNVAFVRYIVRNNFVPHSTKTSLQSLFDTQDNYQPFPTFSKFCKTSTPTMHFFLSALTLLGCVTAQVNLNLGPCTAFGGMALSSNSVYTSRA